MGREPRPVADAVRDTTVGRAAFEDAVRKLLESAPTTKKAVSRKIDLRGRRRPLRQRLLPDR